MYKNPINIVKNFEYGPDDIFCNPDPFVIKFCGQYYCYSSGEFGVNILVSKDLTFFEHRGFAYTNENEYSYWAPAVSYINGVFYLYYSSLLRSETDDHKHYLRVAQSKHPEGPFEFITTMVSDFAIDPHVFRTDEGLFLLYSRNVTTNTDRIGTVIAIDRMLSPTQVAGESKNIILPSLDEEIFAKNRFGDGRDWHTIEGAFFYTKEEYRYIFYSGNAYTSPDYFVGYAVADGKTPLFDTVFNKYPNSKEYKPLVASKGFLSGTGHNSVIKAPDNMTDIIVYHGVPNDTPSDGRDHRQLCIDPMSSKRGVLFTNAPSSGEWLSIPRASVSTAQEAPSAWMYTVPASHDRNILMCGDRIAAGSFYGNGGVVDTWLKIEEGCIRLTISPALSFSVSSDLNGICVKDSRGKCIYRSDNYCDNPQVHHHFSVEWTNEKYCIFFDEVLVGTGETYGMRKIDVSLVNVSGTTELGSVELTVIMNQESANRDYVDE